MKEFYCQHCRRHKKISLHSSGTLDHAVCSACTEKADKAANRTEKEEKRHHDQNVSRGKRYRKNINDSELKIITGEE